MNLVSAAVAPFLYLLFSLTPLTSAIPDVLQLDATFTCRFSNRATWQLVVNAYEDDVFSAHDWIGSWKGDGVPGVETTSIIINGTADGDEMTSGGYRPFLEIWHNCTPEKFWLRLILKSQKLCRVGYEYPKICHYKFVKDVTDTSGEELVVPSLTYDLRPI